MRWLEPMTRFSRINTIWRKELIDTLRDRRTLIAMVLVPMVLYPALMLGSLQAFEAQISFLVTERYDFGVASDEAGAWLRRMLDTDETRREAQLAVLEEQAADQPASSDEENAGGASAPSPRKTRAETTKTGVRHVPPEYDIWVVENVPQSVADGAVHAGLLMDDSTPSSDASGSTSVAVVFDESDIRSEIAATGVRGVLERANVHLLKRRLREHNLTTDFVRPIALTELNVASPERMAGALLGQIVPLILIVMTLTGAVYPAIDLTAGERERGTLETLMVAPVPSVDLITGKFIVVTLIGLLSAVLNLLSIGGTIYLGGLGSLLSQGADFAFPLWALPWIMLLLAPLAVMFSAMLLAVCSFARSFKEAQNYIVPVMMAALIPGVVGILPGTRLEGPIVIMPVANIVVLTRELFLGRFDYVAISLVLLSTSLYAGAAVAVAARLFGQEAVLFADSGSIKTVFQRRFFKPRAFPSAAQALLVVTVVYSLNFYVQQGIAKSGLSEGLRFLNAIALTIIVLFGIGPWLAARYMRVNATTTFQLGAPSPRALLAGLCFGASTWLLAAWWLPIQLRILPMDSNVARMLEEQFAWFSEMGPLTLVFFIAVVPALCEELFFRGYALSGLRSSLGKAGALVVVSIAFGMAHYSAHRLVVTTSLGLLLGLLVLQYRSIWPAMLAHFMHNAMGVLASNPDGLQPWLERLGYSAGAQPPPLGWVIAATSLVGVGVLICVAAPRERATSVAQVSNL